MNKLKEVIVNRPSLQTEEKAPLPHNTVILTIQKRINITKFAHEIFLNLPEYSTSLNCTTHRVNGRDTWLTTLIVFTVYYM